MTAEDIFAFAALIVACGGVLLAVGSFGLRGILGAAALVGLVWAAVARSSEPLATNLLMTAVIGGIGVGHLRLGWFAARHWPQGRALLALGLLALMPVLGLVLMRIFPGSGFLANLGYVLGVCAFSLPAAVGFALGLAAAALRRRLSR